MKTLMLCLIATLATTSLAWGQHASPPPPSGVTPQLGVTTAQTIGGGLRPIPTGQINGTANNPPLQNQSGNPLTPRNFPYTTGGGGVTQQLSPSK